ncbi:MAG: hypothetical protein JXR76_16330 [Deltaproteobacteria bacterium]|nr:hypothetical protein [Deltaproteobacteria bacterium]
MWPKRKSHEHTKKKNLPILAFIQLTSLSLVACSSGNAVEEGADTLDSSSGDTENDSTTSSQQPDSANSDSDSDTVIEKSRIGQVVLKKESCCMAACWAIPARMHSRNRAG